MPDRSKLQPLPPRPPAEKPERMALALLRGGFSFDDAAKMTKPELDEIMRLWRKADQASRRN